jgi:hypothetical protein
MGAIVNLYTPNTDFTAEHAAFIESIPAYLRELMSCIKQARALKLLEYAALSY